mmetsp:Transcript_136411/g.353608  ORF Transcript_136411/g.353608 Transcript_136411/m.353608 type:complete len:185 (-) Transcript_136411:899-1453(-)
MAPQRRQNPASCAKRFPQEHIKVIASGASGAIGCCGLAASPTADDLAIVCIGASKATPAMRLWPDAAPLAEDSAVGEAARGGEGEASGGELWQEPSSSLIDAGEPPVAGRAEAAPFPHDGEEPKWIPTLSAMLSSRSSSLSESETGGVWLIERMAFVAATPCETTTASPGKCEAEDEEVMEGDG